MDDLPAIAAIQSVKEDGTAPFRTQSFEQLAARPVTEMRHHIEGLLPERCLVALYGAGSIGKTMLCIQMAEAIATGQSFMELKTIQGPVLAMLSEDDTDETARRIQRLKGCSPDAHVIEFSDVEDPCLMRFESYSGAPLPTQTFARLESTIKSINPNVVMLDPIGFLFGGNENDRQAVSAFCRSLANLCARYDCTILLVGHPAKAESSQYSGSTAWNGSVRTRLLLVQDEHGAPDEYRLRKPKSNYSPNDDVGLHIVKVPGGFFRPASCFNLKKERAERLQAERNDADNLVKEFCEAQHKQGKQMPNKSLATNSAYSLIKALWPDRIGSYRPKDLQDSMIRLEDEGWLIPVQETSASRHKKQVLRPKSLIENPEF